MNEVIALELRREIGSLVDAVDNLRQETNISIAKGNDLSSSWLAVVESIDGSVGNIADSLSGIAKSLETLAGCVTPEHTGGRVEWDSVFRVGKGGPT